MAISGKEAIKKLEKQYKRQNDYIKNNYDRVSITLQRGTKERIKSLAGQSVNAYINALVVADLDRMEALEAAENQGFEDDTPECFR